ncbi:hypothetical protein E2C01_047568 [Portunus trituberculatus]|uniref:Uncharacterized protein n=1 Tax=Portunus trituberculatus TaxID=210409 RepID=A0A5B7G0Y1_PORTR|nr:hypothetical protein [Portunus trituberculatus]
MLTCPGAGLL